MMKENLKKVSLLLLICNLIGVLLWIQPSYVLLVNPSEEGILNSGAKPLAYLYVFLGSLCLISAYYVYKLKRIAAGFFLGTLCFIAAYSVRESIFLIDYFISQHHEKPEFSFTLNVWWAMSEGARWIAWTFINYWFLRENKGERAV